MSLTVGFAGITGRVAQCVIHDLLKEPHVLIKGYCRDPTKLPAVIRDNKRVTLFKGQTDDRAALKPFVEGVDVMVCAYLAENAVMTAAQKLLVDLCVEAKVDRYVASDWTLEYPSLTPGMFVKKDPILEINAYLESKPIKTIHILNGMFVETLFSELFYFYEPGTPPTFKYYGSGDELMDLTSYYTAGQYTAALILDKNAVGFYRFRGDKISSKGIIADFTSVYGYAPKVEVLGTLDDLHKESLKTGEQDYIMTGAWLILNGKVYLKEPLDADKYPQVKPRTIKDFFKEIPVEKLQDSLVNVPTRLAW
ncbi:hypothetical protein HYFRA_00003902 [Hymenoscyphus fraxineus]|uniref:NAD(P)-binding domain-containing protein n=1 Tax=Hymenoscyphus fraxineus TaxID=746836 RepID=A0A9N9KY27_9HELO|nr:hypothetical protein HYFRA_00003902 [Hymenoscyphus fraxineus]